MSSVETAAPEAATETAPRRRGLRRVLITIGALGLVLALVAGGAVWLFDDPYAGKHDRASGVFASLAQAARNAAATPAQQPG